MNKVNIETSLPVIAILGGTGKEGPGLALRWASVGFPVIIGSRQKEKAQSTAEDLNDILNGNSVVGMHNNLAAEEADISVLTVVHTAHQPALKGLKPYLQDKILVDATARVDFRKPKPPTSPSAGRIAQNILGEGVRVVAAFQNVPAFKLRKNLGQELDIDVLVCADDQSAAIEVINIIEKIGMRAFYTGDLDNAIVVEGLTSLLIGLNKFYGVKTASIGITGI